MYGDLCILLIDVILLKLTVGSRIDVVTSRIRCKSTLLLFIHLPINLLPPTEYFTFIQM